MLEVYRVTGDESTALRPRPSIRSGRPSLTSIDMPNPFEEPMSYFILVL